MLVNKASSSFDEMRPESASASVHGCTEQRESRRPDNPVFMSQANQLTINST
jgi:hypothetical protein